MKKIGRLSIIYLIIILSTIVTPLLHHQKSMALSESQKNTADAIADISIEEWPTYGIFPSIAVAQAFVESGLGDGGNNLFGVNGCYGLDLVSATYRYLQCLHNKYFKGTAAWRADPEEQLYYILERGLYCEGEYPHGNYYYNVVRSIYRYGWDKYDDRLQKILEKQEQKRKQKMQRKLRIKRQREPFHIIFSDKVPIGTCVTDAKYIPKNSTVILGYYILEVDHTKKHLGNTIILHKPNIPEMLYNFWTPPDTVNVEVIEDAKG